MLTLRRGKHTGKRSKRLFYAVIVKHKVSVCMCESVEFCVGGMPSVFLCICLYVGQLIPNIK